MVQGTENLDFAHNGDARDTRQASLELVFRYVEQWLDERLLIDQPRRNGELNAAKHSLISRLSST